MNFPFKLKSFRRLAAFVLLSVMLLGMLSGCGVIIINRPGESTSGTATTVRPETSAPPETEPEDTGEETDPPAVTDPPETKPKGEPVEFPENREEEAKKRLDELSEAIDISEYKIVFVSAKGMVNMIYSDEESPLYAARSRRNDMLFEKYGVDVLIPEEYGGGAETDDIYNDLAAALKSGSSSSYYLDMLLIPASSAGKFLAGGLLKDMRLLPFYNASSGPTSGNIGNSRYFDIGDGSDAPEYIYALYFNRGLFGNETEKMLYASALNGDLSYEVLFGAAKAIENSAADIGAANGRNVFGELAAPLLGIDFVSNNVSGTPKLALSESERASIDFFIEKVRNFTFYAPAEGEASASDIFVSGKMPFYIGTLGDIGTFYDDAIEWGILPLPSEKKLSAFSADRPVLCIPATNSRLEQTSLWLSGFNAASGDWIRDSYLSVAIERYLRDNNSCLTFFEILSRKSVIGFERLYDGYYEGLADATYLAAGSAMSGQTKFSEVYLNKLSAINKKLAKLP